MEDLRAALQGLPFADEAAALIEKAYKPGASMGSAFAAVMRELFAPYGLLLIDPMDAGVRAVAAPFMAEAVKRMPELADAVMARNQELERAVIMRRSLVDKQTSLVFLLDDGHRIGAEASERVVVAPHRKWTAAETGGAGGGAFAECVAASGAPGLFAADGGVCGRSGGAGVSGAVAGDLFEAAGAAAGGVSACGFHFAR